MQNSTPTTETGNGQMTALRWISAIVSGLVVITAFVIGEGFFGGNATLIEDHGYLGNAIFALAAVQLILAFLQYQKGTLGRNHLLLNGLLIVALFAQIGLGYSGSRSGAANALVWHLPVGVLIMGLSTLNAALLWTRPNRTPIVT
jgi:cytochrome b561